MRYITIMLLVLAACGPSTPRKPKVVSPMQVALDMAPRASEWADMDVCKPVRVIAHRWNDGSNGVAVTLYACEFEDRICTVVDSYWTISCIPKETQK